jgi:hypothetical protein
MRKRFIVTESEKKNIRNLYEQVAPAKPLPKAPVAAPQQGQTAPANTLAILKECAAAIAANTPLYLSKVFPGYVIFNSDLKNSYKQATLSNNQLRRTITLNAFQIKPGTVNVIYKDLVLGDESDINHYGDATWTNCPDVASYVQYLNKQAPKFPFMHFENSQFADMPWWRLTSYISKVTGVPNMLNILKQVNPNIAKDILNSFGMSQGLADQALYKQIEQASGVTPQQAAPQQANVKR